MVRYGKLVALIMSITLIAASCADDDESAEPSSTGDDVTSDASDSESEGSEGADDGGGSETSGESNGSAEGDEVELTQSDGWCSNQDITYFVGGSGAESFSLVLIAAAELATADTGANVEMILSDWDSERMVSQLREEIARQPDGIAMMGHAGDEAIMPLAADAADAGIVMHYQNVDVPEVRAMFGGGYTGASLYGQAAELARTAIDEFGLQAGDSAFVFGAFGQPGREQRELGLAETFEDAGLEVERFTYPEGTPADPLLLTPMLSGAVLDNPDVDIIALGGPLATTQQYLEAAGPGPGEIPVIGFDLNEQILDVLEGNWAQITADQQPFLQGYLPILSLCLQLVYGLSPLNNDTGAGFIRAENVESVRTLVEQGYR